jgi:hypothetical protein
MILQTINSLVLSLLRGLEKVACKLIINKVILDVGFLLYRGFEPV